MKLLIAIAFIFLALIALCALTTSLTTSAASLANGIAMTQMANTLLTSQCLGAIVAIIGIFGGAGIGMAFAMRRSPAARLSNRRRREYMRLPAEQIQYPIPTGSDIVLVDELPEDEPDQLFKGWGWNDD